MSMAIGGASLSGMWGSGYGAQYAAGGQRASNTAQGEDGMLVQPGTPQAEDTAAAKLEQRNEKLGKGCRTCASRKYQDESNDPGVSFQSATSVRAESAGAAVMAHEQEHVTREQQRAGREGREVIGQSVTLHMGICPECHRPYVAGGTTRTTTAAAKQKYTQAANGFPQEQGKGFQASA